MERYITAAFRSPSSPISVMTNLTVLMILFLPANQKISWADKPVSYANATTLAFTSGTFEGWTVEQETTWTIGRNPDLFTMPDDPQRFIVNSYEQGEANMGVLRSHPFRIEKELQRFSIAGWDGTLSGVNNGDRNFVLLRSHPDRTILRRAHTPGCNRLTPFEWITAELIDQTVYLEVRDNNPGIRSGGFAWIAFADYRQETGPLLSSPVDHENLFAVKIDEGTERLLCRTLPFEAALPEKRGKTRRIMQQNTEIIPLGFSAETLYLLGMINEGWDMGVAHWGEHPELRSTREDQVYIGTRIGNLEFRYASGESDWIPLDMGATAWFTAQWAYGPSHHVSQVVKEPFLSRPEFAEALHRTMKVKEDQRVASQTTRHAHYFLAVKPRREELESIVVHDNPAIRGKPLVAGITISRPNSTGNLIPFGRWRVNASDLKPALEAQHPQDWKSDLTHLANLLYTKETDLPRKVDLIDFPPHFEAARIRFLGQVEADMMSNIWVANLTQIAEKFDRNTGFFHESGRNSPWYGGYSGIGTWIPIGVYYSGAYPRCSDHFASLALRCIIDPTRNTNYVDFVDKGFYFFRDNHDPNNGPPNVHLEVAKYPSGVPGHWGFVCPPGAPPWQINEIPGEEEMDGHGVTMVARWLVWRTMGKPTDDWLTAPRKHVYGNSRWDTTLQAAEFVCWLMDHTGMDVMWCEGETTGWGGRTPAGMQLTGGKDWPNETDPETIKKYYANANMYEPYPTYVCMTALRCSAQIADAVRDSIHAEKWHRYADRLQSGMIRLLTVGEHGNLMWKQSRFSVYPSLQDSLVQAWFSIYYDGLDPTGWNQKMTAITRNTLKRQLSYPYGHKPVLAMGYGIGWLTKAALVLDEMDDAGQLLLNIAKYSYDKNMNYRDEGRGIDWRRYLWLIPEGTNILPDGSWYRIGDLTNGANQGPAMHALELCAGIDDTNPATLKILPRVPDPLYGLEVSNFPVLIPQGQQLLRTKVSYYYNRRKGQFRLTAEHSLPCLTVRLGPFDETTARCLARSIHCSAKSNIRTVSSGTYRKQTSLWIWIEDLKNITRLKINLGA